MVPATVPTSVAVASDDAFSDVGGRLAGHAEIENLDAALVGQHHVLGFQIAVHDPFGMGGGEAFGNLPGDRPGLPDRQGAVRDRLAERAALDELHGNPRQAVALADVVDGDDGRMVERRGGAGFGFETPAAALVPDQPLGNHLERHGATEPRVDAAVDLTHASRAEEVLDFVGPESIAGDERHRAAP